MLFTVLHGILAGAISLVIVALVGYSLAVVVVLVAEAFVRCEQRNHRWARAGEMLAGRWPLFSTRGSLQTRHGPEPQERDVWNAAAILCDNPHAAAFVHFACKTLAGLLACRRCAPVQRSSAVALSASCTHHALHGNCAWPARRQTPASVC